jgi:hypothetical protein
MNHAQQLRLRALSYFSVPVGVMPGARPLQRVHILGQTGGLL